MPQPRRDDVEDALLAAEREFKRSIDNRTNYNEDVNINITSGTQPSAFATLLTSSKQLCITIIETAFEAIDTSDTDNNDDYTDRSYITK